MEYLLDKLKEYCHSDAYPFHMPGHKRNKMYIDMENPFLFDITEIDGFDNLHHAEGIIKEAQKRASKLYGTIASYFLVNGSTCGILTAISACCKEDGKLLIARNCHKAVYHSILLNKLSVEYLYPSMQQEYGLNGGIDPNEIEEKLEKDNKIKAVFITSPTYDGIISDVEKIAKIVHRYNIPLIVDEAHGAHLSFHKNFPDSAVNLGADIVIHSVHKTLPSLTQTALLHICSNRIDKNEIEKYLSIYQTSSPSYILMASIDSCIRYMSLEGMDQMEIYQKRLIEYRERLKNLKNLKLIDEEIIGKDNIYNLDKSKIILSTVHTNLSGLQLMKMFREQYHIELEMAEQYHIVAISTLMDTDEGFIRFCEAAEKIDQGINDQKIEDKKIIRLKIKAKQKMNIYEADLKEKISVDIRNASGKISGEYVYLYPPGIPMIVPGEYIEQDLIEEFLLLKKRGYALEGMNDYRAENILVIKD